VVPFLATRGTLPFQSALKPLDFPVQSGQALVYLLRQPGPQLQARQSKANARFLQFSASQSPSTPRQALCLGNGFFLWQHAHFGWRLDTQVHFIRFDGHYFQSGSQGGEDKLLVQLTGDYLHGWVSFPRGKAEKAAGIAAHP
jgi:hypothetical protein